MMATSLAGSCKPATLVAVLVSIPCLSAQSIAPLPSAEVGVIRLFRIFGAAARAERGDE